MRFCTKCGSPNSDSTIFCVKCGTNLGIVQPGGGQEPVTHVDNPIIAPPPQWQHTPHAQPRPVAPNPLPNSRPPNVPLQRKQKKSSKTPIIVVTIIAITIIAIVAIIAFVISSVSSTIDALLLTSPSPTLTATPSPIKEDWRLEGYEDFEPYRQFELKFVNGFNTGEKRYTGVTATVDWRIEGHEDFDPYREFELKFVNGINTGEKRYTGATASVEWRLEGYEDFSPYRQFELKFVNGINTGEKRYTGNTKPAPAPSSSLVGSYWRGGIPSSGYVEYYYFQNSNTCNIVGRDESSGWDSSVVSYSIGSDGTLRIGDTMNQLRIFQYSTGSTMRSLSSDSVNLTRASSSDWPFN